MSKKYMEETSGIDKKKQVMLRDQKKNNDL